MSVIVGLVLAAAALVFFELLLPGGILGAIAGICILVATVLTAHDYGFWMGMVVFGGSIIAICIMGYLEFKCLSKQKAGGFMLNQSITGHSNTSQAEAEVIGKQAITLTRLNPSGKVAIDGQSYDAYSQDGYIETDQPVIIVSQDSFKLIIKKL